MIQTAQYFVSPSTQDPSGTFNITGSVAINLLTVTAVTGTPIVNGQLLDDVSGILPYGLTITGQKSGTAGGTGVYYLSFSAIDTVASESMFLTLSPYGQAGPGSLWYQTDTNLLFNRNTANTGWTQVVPAGSTINTTALGLWPLAGVTLASAPTGSTNLVTKDGLTQIVAPPFILSKNSLAATLVDLNNLEVSMASQLNILVQEQISQIGTPSANANIIVVAGTLGTYAVGTYGSPINLSIPYAGLTYADGTQVGITDCRAMASLNTFNPIIGGSAQTNVLVPLDPYGMTWNAYGSYTPGNVLYNYKINYLLIAVKPSA